MKKKRGSGSVYLRGQIWWIQYWDHGVPRAESSRSVSEEDAKNLLAKRIKDIADGRDMTPEKCTIADLCRLVIEDYRLRKLRDVQTVEWRYEAHIKKELGHLRAGKLSSDVVKRYILNRRRSGAEDATINRELSIIRRGFTLGAEEDPPLVRRQPKIRKLDEDNARQGFLEPEQYESLLEVLPERLKALYVCAYHVGTRKGELRKVRIDQVDLDAKLIRIEKRQSKAKKPRTLPIYADMERWLRAQIASAPEGWLFHNGKGRVVGARLDGWREACEAVGLPGLLFHDLRRSAIRNMKRAGLQDKVAMEISGHKTRSVFDRYNIIDEGDIEAAGEKMTRYFANRKRQRAAKLRRVK